MPILRTYPGTNTHCTELVYEEAVGCKTRAGALNRVNRFLKLARVGDGFRFVVLHREDGLYVPVAILNDRNHHLALALIHQFKIAVA